MKRLFRSTFLNTLSASEKRDYLVLLLVATLYFTSNSMMIYTPKFIVAIGGEADLVGRLIFMQLIPFLMLSLFSGHLSSLYGSKWLVVCGCFIHVILRTLYPQMEHISPMLTLLAIGNGFAHVMVFTPLFAAVARCVPDQKKAQGIGYFTVAIQIGNSMGTLIGEELFTRYGFQLFFHTAAMLALTSALFCLALKDSPRASHTTPDSSNSSSSSAMRHTMRHHPFTLVLGGLLLIMIMGMILGTTLQFISLFFDQINSTLSSGRMIPAKSFLTSAMLTIALVRFTVGRTLDGPYRSFILRFCHAGLLISLIAIPFISSLTSSILIAIGFGLSYGLIYPSLNAEVLTICPAQHRGKVSGALTLVFETGFRGYAPIAGSLIVLSGYSALFWTTALIYLAGLFIYYLHKRHLSL